MDMEQIPVITIEREYAAGGRSVAKLLAEALEIPWYDYDFILQTAIDSGLSVEDIMKDGESFSKSEQFWDMLLGTSELYTSMHDKVFYAQRDVIIKLAQKPCIIVGRAADAICKEAAIRSFNVFLYTDDKHKVQRGEELEEYSEGTSIEKYIVKRDEARANFYKTYTGKEFADPHNYDICLNTAMGFETCAKILVSCLRSNKF